MLLPPDIVTMYILVENKVIGVGFELWIINPFTFLVEVSFLG